MGSAELNDTMNSLTRKGMQFVQCHEQDTLRVYYGRQMTKYSKLDQAMRANARNVNYGTANILKMQHEHEMREFLTKIFAFLRTLEGVEPASEDGGGPATMWVASTTAADNDVLTSGVAIFAEAVDNQETRVSEYDSYWMYPIRDLVIRQRDMDLSGLFVFVHEGGLGTLMEDITSVLSIQLLEKIPIPIFVIDQKEALKGYRQQIKEMCTADESGAFLAAPWVEKLFVFCESYEEAYDKFTELVPNLKKLWYELYEAGMKLEDFETSVEHTETNLKNRGLPPHADFIMDQVYGFIDEIKKLEDHKSSV